MDVKVACSGIEGSNAQAACMKFFTEGEIAYVDSFRAVLEAVASGDSEFGVLPVENSFNGSVREVYNLLMEYRFSVVKSLLLPIRHSLLARNGVTLGDIKRVYSHPQALGQCSEFLSRLDAKTIPFWNTAGAAKMVSESDERDIAAIASPLCSELYGLNELARDIQDRSDNYTKFVCVHKEPVIYPGATHMSLIIGCENKPGALNAILGCISEHGVNMNKLESYPKPGCPFEYLFFVEMEASVNDSGIPEMIAAMRKNCSELALLGSYEVI